jgi:Ca2+-transporting ATPase
MGYERKKRSLTAIPIPSPTAASSAANYRVTQHSATANGYPPKTRSPSPPASAYFPLLSGQDTTSRLRPTPNAEAHFAYSTTLRRHQSETAAALASPAVFAAAVNAEAAGLWTRIINTITGRRTNEYQPVGRETPTVAQREEMKNTASGKFAHLTVEVSSSMLVTVFVLFLILVNKATINFFRTSGVNGLLHSDINILRANHGYNEFSVASPEPLLLKFAKTIYESPLILLLCGSATISALMGNIDDAISITVAVLIVLTGMNCCDHVGNVEGTNFSISVGFVQERRSEESLEALNKLVPHHCNVIRYGSILSLRLLWLTNIHRHFSDNDREGKTLHVLANELVPGDLVKLATGDRIPADVRLIDAVDLEVDESSLTGETDSRKKGIDACQFESGALSGEPVALAERTCIGYMGTLVRNGQSYTYREPVRIKTDSSKAMVRVL